MKSSPNASVNLLSFRLHFDGVLSDAERQTYCLRSCQGESPEELVEEMRARERLVKGGVPAGPEANGETEPKGDR